MTNITEKVVTETKNITKKVMEVGEDTGKKLFKYVGPENLAKLKDQILELKVSLRAQANPAGPNSG